MIGAAFTAYILAAPVAREPGHYKFEVKYQSLVDVPARLQFWWEGEAFVGEPLPAWRLGHIPSRPARGEAEIRVRRGQDASRGRRLAGEYGCARCHPGTPMPGVFPHGKPATLATVLDGDPAKQKDALWAYLGKGKDAPSPTLPPAVPLAAPARGEDVIVAQIPIRMPDDKVVEAICVLTADHDLLVYDVAEGRPVVVFVGGQILRNVQGRIRQFLASGTAVKVSGIPILKHEGITLLGYDRLPDGVRIRWQSRTGEFTVDEEDTLRFVTTKYARQLIREIRIKGIENPTIVKTDLPAAKSPPAWENKPLSFPDDPEGSLERPGDRAVMYARPKTVSGEDSVMPGAVAVRPKDGKVFVALMKTGELFTLKNADDAKRATFELYGRGLYQDALSMLAEDDGLYVLHRRNLTKIVERDGRPERFEHVFALLHGIADTYDMAYGLARGKSGAFVMSYAPYANATLPGSGGAIRMRPGKPPEEVAFGMRNPLGWCAGPEGEIFFTDNQGDWVAANKLCHVSEGKFYGWRTRRRSSTSPGPRASPRFGCPTRGRGRSTASPTTTPAASSGRSRGNCSWPS